MLRANSKMCASLMDAANKLREDRSVCSTAGTAVGPDRPGGLSFKNPLRKTRPRYKLAAQ